MSDERLMAAGAVLGSDVALSSNDRDSDAAGPALLKEEQKGFAIAESTPEASPASESASSTDLAPETPEAAAPAVPTPDSLSYPGILYSTQLGAIFKRELVAYFMSPMSYLVWGVFLIAAGYLFTTGLKDGANASLSATFIGMVTLLLFVTPLITMRLISDELRSGTLEILLTDPVTDGTVVAGKFGAAVVFFTTLLSPTLTFPLILKSIGQPDMGPIISGYIGLFLIGALFLAIGVMASAIASNQIASAALSFTIIFIIWALGRAAESIGPGTMADVLEYISTQSRFDAFQRGIIDTRSIVYFTSLTSLALLLATHALGLRRLR